MHTQTRQPKVTETKFSMSQVADLIGVHRTTILRLLDAGKLAIIKLGIAAS